MKQFQIIGLLCITAINLTFCAMKQELQTEFPQETQSVFYQKQKVGKGNGGIQFYIEFKKALATNLNLAKISLLSRGPQNWRRGPPPKQRLKPI